MLFFLFTASKNVLIKWQHSWSVQTSTPFISKVYY
jgi:hypothetical protein